MVQQLDRATLGQILQAEDLERLPIPDLIRLFHQEEGIRDFLPDGVCQIDPRNGDRILFNSSRAHRPHDNWPSQSVEPGRSGTCIVCQGRITGVVDVADLTQGFTFINKNLYPSLYPLESSPAILAAKGSPGDTERGARPYGLHFLQWTSSWHDMDWHNMPLADRVVVMQRLAALERKLITADPQNLPPGEFREEHIGVPGFVLIIKNYGYLVGGSLAHGHQQIALSNIMPRRIHDNWRFEKERGEKFSTYLLRENPAELLIRDYGPAVLVVPYFMRRPYDMLLLLRNAEKQYLHQLTANEIMAVADGWHDALRAIRSVMPETGKQIAYNVVTHNGPGAGLYFEFLPYTQETGGFEHLGLWVCQSNPQTAVTRIRASLKCVARTPANGAPGRGQTATRKSLAGESRPTPQG